MKKNLHSLVREVETAIDWKDFFIVYNSQRIDLLPILKPYIIEKIQIGENKQVKSHRNHFFQIKHIFKGFFNLFKRTDTLIFSNVLEKREINKQLVDKLFDAIQTRKEFKAPLTIETLLPSKPITFKNLRNNKSVSRGFLFVLEVLIQKVFLKKVHIDKEIEEQLKSYFKKKEISIDISDIIEKSLAQQRAMRFFLRFKRNIKYCFLSVHYTQFGYMRALKQKGIIVTELQHGVINENHAAYYYSEEPQTNQFPDYILTFGNNDTDYLNKSKLSRFVKAFPLGNFLTNHYFNTGEDINELRSVAVSLQDWDFADTVIFDVIEIASVMPEVTFFLKRRRTALRYFEKFDLPNNVIFEEEKDIYALIASCDLHITAFSTCALEAPSLGKANVFININRMASQLFENVLPPSNFNFYCENTAEVISVIKKGIPLNPDEIRRLNASNISPNYQENLNSFVNRLSKYGDKS